MHVNLYLLVVCLLIPFCLSQQRKNIIFDDLSATLVGVAPNYILQLLPPRVNDPTQQWIFTPEGYIASAINTSFVFDITGDSKFSWTRVGLYTRNPGIALNQLWVVHDDGSIESEKAAGFYLYPAADKNPNYLVVTYKYITAHIENAINKTWNCESSGDPHIYSFPRGRKDLWFPGIQAPGDYLLAKFGNTSVYENHVYCGANNGVYCNDKLAIVTSGRTIIIRGDNVTIDGIRFTFTGTINLGGGVNITRQSKGNFLVYVPNGKITVRGLTFNGYNQENIYVAVWSGPEPSGGLCTEYYGPNGPPSRWCVRSVNYTVAQFVESWKVLAYCLDPFNYPTFADWDNANPLVFNSTDGNITTTDPVLQAAALNLCAPLLTGFLVSNCSQYVAPAGYYQSCLGDVIASGIYQFAAPIINSYAVRCVIAATTPVALPTSGSISIAYGPGLGNNLAAAVRYTFTIAARDVDGNNRTTGGDTWVVNATGPAPLNFTIVDNHNGLYTVSYTPPVVGNYTISVLYRSVDEIADSPFFVSVVPGASATDPALSIAYGPGLISPIYSGNLYAFTVQAKTAAGDNRNTGGDTLNVTITGFAPLRTTDNQNGTYLVQYEQIFIGNYTVTVKLNNGLIKGSPFALTST